MAIRKKHNITVIIPTLWQEQTVIRVTPTLRSLVNSSKASTQVNLQLILYVNGATEKTQENLQKKISKEFKNIYVVGSQLNKGFTGGVNESLLWSFGHLRSNWYVVLNDDASVKLDFFERFLLEIKEGKPDIVSCGVEDMIGNSESFGLNYFVTGLAFPVRKLQHTEKKNRNIFCGTCVWFSHQLTKDQLQKSGYLFNPLYFAYAEDLECSLRLHLQNKSITLIPEMLVTHQGSATAGRASSFQLYHGYRNLVLTMIFLWSKKRIAQNIVWILLGQLYILLHTFYKGYWFLYPRILWYIFKNRSELALQRNIYEKQIGYLYTT